MDDMSIKELKAMPFVTVEQMDRFREAALSVVDRVAKENFRLLAESCREGAADGLTIATLTAENAALKAQPDWSDSETGISEPWKSPLQSLQMCLQIADGAVAFRDKVIANLRGQIKAQLAAAEPVPGAVWQDGCVQLVLQGYEDSRVERFGAKRLYTAPPQHAAADEPTYKQWCIELVAALKALSFAAQTTGGTAGCDEQLVAAIARAESAMSYGGASRAIDAAEQHAARVPESVLHLVRFLASTWVAIDKAVHEHVGADFMGKYPVIQGTKNQLDLMKVANQPFEKTMVREGVEFMLAAPTPPAQEN